MGTLFRIQIYAESEDKAAAAAEAAFARIGELNGIFSDYEANSELMRFCHAPAGTPVALSDELFEILDHAQKLAARSDGAFDVTIGPLIRLWRLSHRDGRLPTQDQLATAFERSGYRKLVLDPQARTGTLTVDHMRLDLGGIAKGFAADEALQILRAHGFPRSLVAASGDIAIGDSPPGEKGWRIGLTSVASPEEPDQFVLLANAAVSTSGDTQQFVEIDGTRYSHIVDPRTGLGLTERRSVSVVAPSAMETDSLATCLSVLGDVRSLSLDPSIVGVRLMKFEVEKQTLFGTMSSLLDTSPPIPR